MKRHVHRWIWNSNVENKELHAKLVPAVRIRITHPELLDNLQLKF